ncbi:MAG: RsmF rRNA methyltransferase first C-terminal domain-containing protein [Lachnospiraceae bacterium]|nr:RsmF rRNA methyltransferase first C-terminal domain-containing protein [Lachnospiraceae bacterium]
MLPEEFLNGIREMIGEEETLLLEQACEEESVKALRLNPLKKTADDMTDLHTEMKLEKLSYEPDGYLFDPERAPGRRPFHDAGAYYIQDPGAMIPGALLKFSGYLKEGMKVLDLCASPGGKSTQIASAMAGKGILFSNEIVKNRCGVLSANIERMGITNAVVLNETPERLAERFAGYFDIVIVDAPCSGEGLFRKNSDAVLQWSRDNVRLCAERQESILEDAYKCLKSGGYLLYSTCTFERCENEDRVSGLISEHPDMHLLDTGFFKKTAEGLRDGFDDCHDAIRVWPMYFKGEGHFAALLQKEGNSADSLPPGGYEPVSGIKTGKALDEFLSGTLTKEAAGRITSAKDRFRLFGDNLFIMPEDTPSLSGLKVARCGLHIGTFKKDRFEPAHALALALGEGDVLLSKRVDEAEAESFVKGMTLSGDGKGWCLISVGGYSLGWGKASGGIIKNHYPRGLRIQG